MAKEEVLAADTNIPRTKGESEKVWPITLQILCAIVVVCFICIQVETDDVSEGRDEKMDGLTITFIPPPNIYIMNVKYMKYVN